MNQNQKLISDKQAQIRPYYVIKKLPVDQLTDDEICKLFTVRFNAEAIVMTYMEKDGSYHTFARLRSGKKYFKAWRAILRWTHICFDSLKHNWLQIPMDDIYTVQIDPSPGQSGLDELELV